jgi:hypothetical protein
LLVWWISRRLFGVRAALWSVAITAFYSYFIFYSATLMTESFFIIGILLLFQISIGFSMEGAAELLSSRKVWYLKWIALGGTLGICALLRQHIILFAPVLVAWIAWTFLTRPMKESDADSSVGNRLAVKRLSVGIILCLLVFCTMIFPWTLRNYLRFEEFVLLNTNAGFAIFWGNHPIHGTDFIPILPETGPSYQELVPSDWQSLNEAALEKKLFRRGISFIIDDPVRFAWLCLGRAREIFKFWPSDQSSAAANLARVFSFGICLPFMLTGLGRYLRLYRRRTFRDFVRSPGFLVILFVLFHIGVHLLSWGLIRYRLPADAVLIIFAGFGITFLRKERKAVY